MMSLISPSLLTFHLLIFTATMIAVTLFVGRKLGTRSGDAFIVVDRQIPWQLGGPSIAASWTWAVALMVSVQMAYQHGVAGAFWFTAPNIAAVLIYIWLGPQIRAKLPLGYSLPEWIHHRFGHRGVTLLYFFAYYFYQVLAVTVQVYAGAHLLSAVSGLSPLLLMPAILLVTLAYGIVSGLQASVITDLLQMALILIPGWILVSLVISAAGGQMVFHGVLPGGSPNPFEPGIALTMGVISSVGLISGAICDQQFWQRCLAVRKEDIRKTFLFGGLLFGTVPISLALLGFTAAAPGVGLRMPEGSDASLVGFEIVRHLLSPSVATLYLYMLLAGLCSTLDSGLSAASSLDASFQRTLLNTGKAQQDISVLRARRSMLVIAALGLVLAYAVESIPGFGLKYFWWLFNSIAACIAVPTVLSLFWNRITTAGILFGSGVGLCIGLPLVAYSSVTANDPLLAASYIGIIAVSVLSCFLWRSAGREEGDLSCSTESFPR